MQILLIGRESLGDVNKKRSNFFTQGRSEVSDIYVETRFGLRTGERYMHAVGHIDRNPYSTRSVSL
jgi:hypothetical protein